MDNTQAIRKDKTAFAVITAIILVVPALVPAGIVTLIYTYFFKLYLGYSWIPYLDEIGLNWFPELLRGMLVGMIAVKGSRYIFKDSNLEIIRYSTMAFWGAIMLLISVFSLIQLGVMFETIGMIALPIGLAVGLWAAD